MRCYLDSPKSEGSKLFKVCEMQVGEMKKYPMYYCQVSDTYWILSTAKNMERNLVRFDPNKNLVLMQESTPIPQDWEGEPESLHIPITIWEEWKKHYQHFIEYLKEEIRKSNYDYFIVDRNNQITKHVILDNNGELVLETLDNS